MFFKTTCPTCELAWPYLERLRRRAGAIPIVAISQDPPSETRAFARGLGVELTTVYDPPPWAASEAAGLTNVPAFFVVDANGRIRESFLGFQKAKLEELASRGEHAPGGAPREPLFLPDEPVPEMRPG